MTPGVYWWTGAATLGGYVLLFALARRPVSLRPRRVGALLAATTVLRLALVPFGSPLEVPGELVLLAAAGALTVPLLLMPHFWLVRATGAELRQQIRTACRGLFLGVEEKTPGRLILTARGNAVLGVRRWTAGVQWLALCCPPGPGKVALLCAWLSKQYPGPVPRLRFVLKGGAT
jgi:hypothetical protein